MAKEKVKKGMPNKHLHARIAFLHQAAEYLARTVQSEENPAVKVDSGLEAVPTTSSTPNSPRPTRHPTPAPKPLAGYFSTGLPTLLSSHLKTIAQKAQIRLSHDLKHRICKTCSAPLLEGLTSIRSVENRSKGGKKSWANVMVVECVACGTRKRFPVGARRQGRKGLRAVCRGGEKSGVGVEGSVDDGAQDVGIAATEGNAGKDATQEVMATA